MLPGWGARRPGRWPGTRARRRRTGCSGSTRAPPGRSRTASPGCPSPTRARQAGTGQTPSPRSCPGVPGSVSAAATAAAARVQRGHL